jgi:hypothetical protein
MPWKAPHFLGGPVLDWELVRNSRRRWCRLATVVYLGFVGVQLLIAWAFIDGASRSAPSWQQSGYESWQALTNRAEEFLLSQGHLQVWFVFLLTPALLVGGVAKEKEQNTLLALFGSELTAGEIVRGKAVGRAALLAAPVLASIPILAAVAPYAEVRGVRIALLVVQVFVILLAAAGVSVLVSVWTRRMSDALMACYASLLIGYFILETLLADIRLPNWLDPFAIQEQLLSRWNTLDRRLLIGHLTLWSAIGAICLTIASWRLRPVALKCLDHIPPRWLWAFRMPVGDKPVQWRERQVIGVAPLPLLRQVPRGMARLGVLVFSMLVAATALDPTGGRRLLYMVRHGNLSAMRLLVQNADEYRIQIEVGIMGMLLVVAGGTLSLVRAAQTIPEEVRRKTWDDLVVTPLSFREIVEGKRTGISQALGVYALIYAAPMMALAAWGGQSCVIVAVVFFAAAALAIVLASVIGIQMALPESVTIAFEQRGRRMERPKPALAPEPTAPRAVVAVDYEARKPQSLPKSGGRRRIRFLAGFEIGGALAGAAYYFLDVSIGLAMGSNLLLSVCAGLINGFMIGVIFLVLSSIAAPSSGTASSQGNLLGRLKSWSIRNGKMAILVVPVLAAICIRWTNYPVGPTWINYHKARAGMAFPEALQQLGGAGRGIGYRRCLTFSWRDRCWAYEDSHLKIMLRFPTGPTGIPMGFGRGPAGTTAGNPADITVESRGMWNSFTGPILEMIGFGDVSSDSNSWPGY